VSQTLSAALDLEWQRVMDTAKEHLREHLTSRLPTPLLSHYGQQLIQDAVADAMKHPREKTTVKVKMKPGERSLDVNVIVHNPSPATAAAILAAGGRWV
jgi:hypothetical protein